jgi:hypothetical protein
VPKVQLDAQALSIKPNVVVSISSHSSIHDDDDDDDDDEDNYDDDDQLLPIQSAMTDGSLRMMMHSPHPPAIFSQCCRSPVYLQTPYFLLNLSSSRSSSHTCTQTEERKKKVRDGSAEKGI